MHTPEVQNSGKKRFMKKFFETPEQNLNQTIQKAFEEFNEKSQKLTNAYNDLKKEVARVNLELENKNRELENKNRELDRAKVFLDSVFQGMINGIMVLDKEAKIIKVNESLLKLIKKEETDLLCRNIHEINELKPFLRFFESSKHSDSKTIYSACRLTIENEVLWLELSGSGVGEDFILVVHNLTEVRDLRKQLVQNASMAGLGEMAVTVAHEIRNPLGGIEGFASLLKRDLADNPKHLQLLEKIISGVRHLNQFIGGLLTFSKPIPIHPRAVDLNLAIHKAIHYSGKNEELDKYPQVSILTQTDEEIHLSTDPDLIQQLLINLLLNAFQIMNNEGTVKIFLKSVEHLGDYKDTTALKTIKSLNYDPLKKGILISVSDSGPGITPEIGKKLFSPFFTTKAFGTGIGLSMVHKIVDTLEGKIDTYSKSELGGAEFRILLPELAMIEPQKQD